MKIIINSILKHVNSYQINYYRVVQSLYEDEEAAKTVEMKFRINEAVKKHINGFAYRVPHETLFQGNKYPANQAFILFHQDAIVPQIDKIFSINNPQNSYFIRDSSIYERFNNSNEPIDIDIIKRLESLVDFLTQYVNEEIVVRISIDESKKEFYKYFVALDELARSACNFQLYKTKKYTNRLAEAEIGQLTAKALIPNVFKHGEMDTILNIFLEYMERMHLKPHTPIQMAKTFKVFSQRYDVIKEKLISLLFNPNPSAQKINKQYLITNKAIDELTNMLLCKPMESITDKNLISNIINDGRMAKPPLDYGNLPMPNGKELALRAIALIHYYSHIGLETDEINSKNALMIAKSWGWNSPRLCATYNEIIRLTNRIVPRGSIKSNNNLIKDFKAVLDYLAGKPHKLCYDEYVRFLKNLEADTGERQDYRDPFPQNM